MTWTREMDRVLAEKCEGKQTIILNGKPYFPPKPCHCQPGWVESDCEAGPAKPIPYYSTDLPAVVRAAEAWRKAGDGRRWWNTESPYGPDAAYHATIQQVRPHRPNAVFHGSADSLCAALAQALYQAVTA